METRKGALLVVGWLKTYRKYLSRYVKNVIEHNDLDVYFFFKKDSYQAFRTNKKGESQYKGKHDAEKVLRDAIGDRLKLLEWTEGDLQLEYLLDAIPSMERSMRERVRGTIEGREDLFLINNFGFILNQFWRLHHGGRRMKAFMQENEIKYDYIFRTRLDFTVDVPIPVKDLPPLGEREIYIVPHFAYGSHAIRENWVARPDVCFDVCENFILQYMSYLPTNGKADRNILSPEVQLAQYLVHNRIKCYQLQYEIESYFDDDDEEFLKIYPFPGKNFAEKIPLLVTSVMPCEDCLAAPAGPDIAKAPASSSAGESDKPDSDCPIGSKSEASDKASGEIVGDPQKYDGEKDKTGEKEDCTSYFTEFLVFLILFVVAVLALIAMHAMHRRDSRTREMAEKKYSSKQ